MANTPTSKPKFERLKDIEDTRSLTIQLEDISTAGVSHVVSQIAGTITKIDTVLEGAITGADAAITFEIDGTVITGSGITVANSGSAAGTTDSSTPSALNVIAVGETLEMITSGASTGTKRITATFTIDTNVNI